MTHEERCKLDTTVAWRQDAEEGPVKREQRGRSARASSGAEGETDRMSQKRAGRCMTGRGLMKRTAVMTSQAIGQLQSGDH